MRKLTVKKKELGDSKVESKSAGRGIIGTIIEGVNYAADMSDYIFFTTFAINGLVLLKNHDSTEVQPLRIYDFWMMVMAAVQLLPSEIVTGMCSPSRSDSVWIFLQSFQRIYLVSKYSREFFQYLFFDEPLRFRLSVIDYAILLATWGKVGQLLLHVIAEESENQQIREIEQLPNEVKMKKVTLEAPKELNLELKSFFVLLDELINSIEHCYNLLHELNDLIKAGDRRELQVIKQSQAFVKDVGVCYEKLSTIFGSLSRIGQSLKNTPPVSFKIIDGEAVIQEWRNTYNLWEQWAEANKPPAPTTIQAPIKGLRELLNNKIKAKEFMFKNIRGKYTENKPETKNVRFLRHKPERTAGNWQCPSCSML